MDAINWTQAEIDYLIAYHRENSIRWPFAEPPTPTAKLARSHDVRPHDISTLHTAYVSTFSCNEQIALQRGTNPDKLTWPWSSDEEFRRRLQEVKERTVQTIGGPHPETLPGEVWLTNVLVDTPLVPKTRPYDAIGWKTKRRGNTAYSASGEVLPGYYPVFVSISELEAAGFNVFNFWRG